MSFSREAHFTTNNTKYKHFNTREDIKLFILLTDIKYYKKNVQTSVLVKGTHWNLRLNEK